MLNIKALLRKLLVTTSETITTFESGWAVYDQYSTVTLRKCGRVVTLTGALRNTQAKTLGSEGILVFTIPEEYRPAQDRQLCVFQGSGSNRYCVSVYGTGGSHSGEVRFERCTNGTSFASMSSGSWFPFHMTWILGG